MHENAVICASASVVIAADPEEVWGVITDFPDWPNWNPEMSSAKLLYLSDPLRVGGGMAWRSKRMTMSAIFTAVDRNHRITWDARYPGIRSAHAYRLQPSADDPGHTVVTGEEALSGWLARLLRRWLSVQSRAGMPKHMAGLKNEVERRITEI